MTRLTGLTVQIQLDPRVGSDGRRLRSANTRQKNTKSGIFRALYWSLVVDA